MNYMNQPPKGRIITAMILGIVSVSAWWYPFIFSIPCFVLGIVAVSLVNGYDVCAGKFLPMVKTARITGTIGLIISIAYTILWLVLFAALL